MSKNFSDAELEAYLDEMLPVGAMSQLEAVLREDPDTLHRLAELAARRDAGVHTLGSIWRRHRVSCPNRETLGSYLLGVLPDEEAEYLEFHLQTIGCRYCQANLADLQQRQQESNDSRTARRQRYFQSSAGYLGMAEGR